MKKKLEDIKEVRDGISKLNDKAAGAAKRNDLLAQKLKTSGGKSMRIKSQSFKVTADHNIKAIKGVNNKPAAD